MRVLFLLAALAAPVVAQAQVYKCTMPGGKVSFSNVPCKDPEGITEVANTKTNSVGAFATPQQIAEHRRGARYKQAARVTVVADPRTTDPSTAGGRFNKRLNDLENSILERRRTQSSGVTVVHDSSREGQLDRAVRLKHESKMLGVSGQTASPGKTAPPVTHEDYTPPEINTREVPVRFGQAEDVRQRHQIVNKANDPRPQDVSREACVDRKPKRGVIRIGYKEVWPGMEVYKMRTAIGAPSSIHSPVVGMEYWTYSFEDDKKLYVEIRGLCVKSLRATAFQLTTPDSAR